jgi:hypothetical protein
MATGFGARLFIDGKEMAGWTVSVSAEAPAPPPPVTCPGDADPWLRAWQRQQLSLILASRRSGVPIQLREELP